MRICALATPRPQSLISTKPFSWIPPTETPTATAPRPRKPPETPLARPKTRSTRAKRGSHGASSSGPRTAARGQKRTGKDGSGQGTRTQAHGEGRERTGTLRARVRTPRLRTIAAVSPERPKATLESVPGSILQQPPRLRHNIFHLRQNLVLQLRIISDPRIERRHPSHRRI